MMLIKARLCAGPTFAEAVCCGQNVSRVPTRQPLNGHRGWALRRQQLDPKVHVLAKPQVDSAVALAVGLFTVARCSSIHGR
jgi:hypothetical protein